MNPSEVLRRAKELLPTAGSVGLALNLATSDEVERARARRYWYRTNISSAERLDRAIALAEAEEAP